MVKFKKSEWVLITFLIIVFILPFLFVSQFTFPAADDFCRTALKPDQYFNQLEYWYNNLTGRYTNFFLSYLPVYGLNTYRIVLAILFCLLGIAFFSFIRILWSYFNLAQNNFTIVLVSVLLYLTLISQLPTLYEFFYWYAASTVYLISIIFFLFFLIMIIKVLEGKPFHFLLFNSLIILMNGNNEMLILLSNFILFTVLVKNYLKPTVSHKYLIGGTVIGILSALVVIMAPGSGNRQTFYPEAGQVFYSLKSAVLSAGMFSVRSFFELPYLFFYLGLLLLIFQCCRQKHLKNSVAFNPFLLMIASFLALVSVFVVPYYATGGLNVNSGRIGNIIHGLFLIIICFNILNFSVYLKKKNILIFNLPSKIGAVFFLSSYLLLIFFLNKNYIGLRKDFGERRLWKYENAISLKVNQQVTSGKVSGLNKKIPETATLPYWDVSSDENHWSNECYSEYIKNVCVRRGKN